MDTLYGKEKMSDDAKRKLLLHASKLQIPKFNIDVEAPMPLWWSDVIATIKEKAHKA
jgi:hypothetical protein